MFQTRQIIIHAMQGVTKNYIKGVIYGRRKKKEKC